jgi:hypothetical protein
LGHKLTKEKDMDYSEAANSVAETIAKGSKPLTEAQKMLMAGAMAVWMDKARKVGAGGTPKEISDREWAARPSDLREGSTCRVDGVGEL